MAEPVYLDCNATTPIEPAALEAMVRLSRDEYGNAGSRTHRHGSVASRALRLAREQVAAVADASWEEVVFTSGATEANNIAILGLAERASALGRRHLIATQIEHKAVLEPLEILRTRGFDVTLLPVSRAGAVDANDVAQALREDTALVSVMHVNNETGVIQPIRAIADAMENHAAVLHTDAAQGFGKDLSTLTHPRIDLISISGHKIYAPKGIGALIVRSNDRSRLIRPIMHGGGQERGLRPGTVPVHLAGALGVAAELAKQNHRQRQQACLAFRDEMLAGLSALNPLVNGELSISLPNVINLSFGDLDSEAVMIALKNIVSISNGSACTSSNYTQSHVLLAMGVAESQINSATRWSWCHLTPRVNWAEVAAAIKYLI